MADTYRGIGEFIKPQLAASYYAKKEENTSHLMLEDSKIFHFFKNVFVIKFN
jgi:hypothetical protein